VALSFGGSVVGASCEEAKRALESGDAEKARRLIDAAFAEDPADPNVRELYAALHLARAIRLAAAAREARHRDIVRRKIPYEQEFEDEPEVARIFEDALAAVEDVLRVEPRHEKALTAKASILFRRDREVGRPQALEILRGVAVANPENKQVLFAIRKIERPCPKCSDTGFCPYCRGRGSKRLLGIERKCESCHGQGICLACGVL
jgi:tetratricopeptide (TPR) repeat protein